jgi:DeoR/GlpR family transcriptional regulator of sugar metabolism
MTVRRDVRKLADQGLAAVVHGGVVGVTELLTPVDFSFRSHHYMGAKRAIADYSVSLLREGSIVGFDAGSTVLEVARRLPVNMHCTVVTHSLPVMALLARRAGVELVGLGGVLRPEAQEFAGPLALRSLAQLRIQTLLLATAAVRDGQMWTTNGADAEMKQALIGAAEEVILLADSSKFAYSAFMRVADLTAVNTVVTDDLISDSARQAVEQSGATLVVVPVSLSGDVVEDESRQKGGRLARRPIARATSRGDQVVLVENDPSQME